MLGRRRFRVSAWLARPTIPAELGPHAAGVAQDHRGGEAVAGELGGGRQLPGRPGPCRHGCWPSRMLPPEGQARAGGDLVPEPGPAGEAVLEGHSSCALAGARIALTAEGVRTSGLEIYGAGRSLDGQAVADAYGQILQWTRDGKPEDVTALDAQRDQKRG